MTTQKESEKSHDGKCGISEIASVMFQRERERNRVSKFRK